MGNGMLGFLNLCVKRFEVLTVVKMLTLILWIVLPCELVGTHKCFRGIYYFSALSHVWVAPIY
jgi:hypothetical protein